MGSEGDLVASRLTRGCRCFAVWLEDSLAGYGWLSTGPEWIGELQLEIRPGAGEAYVWNCVTLPEHRRKGVFRSLVAGIVGVARRDGLRRLWIGSVAIPAERALGPCGFKPALNFYTLEAAGWRLMRVFPADSSSARHAYGVLSLRSAASIRRSRRRRH